MEKVFAYRLLGVALSLLLGSSTVSRRHVGRVAAQGPAVLAFRRALSDLRKKSARIFWLTMAAAPLLAERHTPDPIVVVNKNKISRIPGFLRADECRKLIDLAESKGFQRSAPSGGGHGRTGREDARNNS